MRKINGVPVEAHTDISSLTGGEVLKWDADNTLMAWEDQDDSSYVPVGDRGLTGGGMASGWTVNATIDYVTISSTGNATDFGDLTANSQFGTASNQTRGVWGGGRGPTNRIEYVTILSTGNATDFGDRTVSKQTVGGCSNGSSDRGLFFSGNGYDDTIDYITITSTGNATDFGNLTIAHYGKTGTSNGKNDRGIMAGGTKSGSPASADIDYVTISSTGNATDFGDLTNAGYFSQGSSSNDTNERGIFAGRYDPVVNVIDYITISSTGNATDFGDLSSSTYNCTGFSNGTNERGVFAGDHNYNTTMEYVTINSTGNTTDFGDLTVGRQAAGGLSNSWS